MQRRHIWDKLVKEIETDEVIVITGPRQVGKTTTLKWLLDQIPSNNKLYFDLENLANRDLFETKNYDSIINELQNRGLSITEKIYLCLDEIQLLDDIPSIIKYLYDNYKIKFFLTGSSSYYIKHHFSESMAGRKIIYEMFPLSFSEFISFKEVNYNFSNKNIFPFTKFSTIGYQQLKDFYQEYIEYGGLPKVVLTTDPSRKKQLLEEIFSSYINIDVQTLSDFKSTNDLRKIIKLLAVRVGSKLNTTEIANITGLSRITVDNYIKFLEQTYIIRTIPVFTHSPDVQTRLQKKPYFIDTGIANINADLSSGSKFENTICNQLSFLDNNLSYFSSRDGEIDFILKINQEVIAFEAKETPTKVDDSILKRRAEKLNIFKYRIIGREPSVTFSEFLWGGFIK